MPAYDFKEVFMDEKQDKGVLVAPNEVISKELIQNLTNSDKMKIFGTANEQSEKHENEDLVSHLSTATDLDEQMQLRSKLTMEFMSYLNPYIENNKSFKMSRSEFKLFMIIPAAITVLLSLFISGGALLAATLIFPLFIYLQVSDKAQMNIFESRIWNAIDAIPEEKLKAVLHSILSNKFNTDYTYSDTEIKEIIYNYMYNDNKEAKNLAKLEVRDRLRFLAKQSKKIIYKNN